MLGGAGKQTFWQRKNGSVASTYPDETLKTVVAGYGGLSDPKFVDGVEPREVLREAPLSSKQVFTPDRWGRLHDSHPELEITPYSYNDKTIELGRFATFINPRTGAGVK